MPKPFAKWLVQERESREWTQADLASYVRVDRSAVLRWESGEIEPRLRQFARLMRVLSADANTVLRMVQDDEQSSAAA